MDSSLDMPVSNSTGSDDALYRIAARHERNMPARDFQQQIPLKGHGHGRFFAAFKNEKSRAISDNGPAGSSTRAMSRSSEAATSCRAYCGQGRLDDFVLLRGLEKGVHG